jgi:hypothetical protein
MAWFLSSGFVRLDDVAMGIPGMFSVIDGLGDMAVGVISVIDGLGDVSTIVLQCGGRGLDWVAASAVVGQDSFSGLEDTLSNRSSFCQCS